MKRRIWTYKCIIAVVFLLLAGSCRKDEEAPPQATTVSDIDGNIYQIVSKVLEHRSG